jgi:uncharacterized protein YndB with AHSA1/START domain
MLRVLLIVLVSLGAIIMAIVVIGYSLPVAHRASRTATVHASPQRIFERLTSVEDFPTWRKSVERVEVVERDGRGQPSLYREVGGDGKILYRVIERVPHRKLVTQIADSALPFGGRWTFEIEPGSGGTALTITEDGEVYNPVFRFVSRFIMGHTRSIDAFLADIGTAGP